jgi:hypothetical protein
MHSGRGSRTTRSTVSSSPAPYILEHSLMVPPPPSQHSFSMSTSPLHQSRSVHCQLMKGDYAQRAQVQDDKKCRIVPLVPASSPPAPYILKHSLMVPLPPFTTLVFYVRITVPPKPVCPLPADEGRLCIAGAGPGRQEVLYHPFSACIVLTRSLHPRAQSDGLPAPPETTNFIPPRSTLGSCTSIPHAQLATSAVC